jgi:hypothetical protein
MASTRIGGPSRGVELSRGNSYGTGGEDIERFLEAMALDFNPRVGAQFRLFEDDAGSDVVRALHLDLASSG